MKRFDFKLASVLRYRAYRTQVAEMKLAEAKQEQLAAIRQIDGFREEKRSASRELKRQEVNGMSGERLRMYRSYLDGLDDREAGEERRLREITELVEERRHAAESERIGKETLEHLQERQRKAHFQVLERAEQKAIDEVLTLRFQVG